MHLLVVVVVVWVLFYCFVEVAAGFLPPEPHFRGVGCRVLAQGQRRTPCCCGSSCKRFSAFSSTSTQQAHNDDYTCFTGAEDTLSYVCDLLAKSEARNEDCSMMMMMNDSDILLRIQAQQEADFAKAQASALVMEDYFDRSKETTNNNILLYEWMDADSSSSVVAVQSLEPVFALNETEAIRSAAQELWSCTGSAASRFTYQYTGNSEAHVSDFSRNNNNTTNSSSSAATAALTAINRALTKKIYPLIRHVFWNGNTTTDANGPLFVYDALVIRYNASAEAMAGQPLHRDLGIVSVNVMLNEAFEGGGTFFENQLLSGNNRLPPVPLKPIGGTGHCLAHFSSQRHAGAGTVRGVRDVLVLFVMAAPTNTVPAILMNARLKQCRAVCAAAVKDKNGDSAVAAELLCRIRHYRLALRYVQDDGEAFQYLGIALMEYAEYLAEKQKQKIDQEISVNDATKTNNVTNSPTPDNDEDNSIEALQAAIECLLQAKSLTPCDARVYNNLGIALGRLEQKKRQSLGDGQVEKAYQKGLELLLQSEKAGCDVAKDFDLLSVNYGLYLANQDRFAESCKILARTAGKHKLYEVSSSSSRSQTIDDAYRLRAFCKRNM